MPVYEYRCVDCRTQFELQRVIAQRDAPAQCPACHGMKCGRLLSLPLSIGALEDEGLRVIGGSPCGSCSATACGGCNVRR